MSFWEALRHRFQGQYTLANIVFALFWTSVTFVLAALASRYAKRARRGVLIRAPLPLNTVALLANATTIVVVIVAFAFILSIWGVPTTAVVTSLSLATAGIV